MSTTKMGPIRYNIGDNPTLDEMLMGHENFESNAYDDGYGYLTIGYGHKIKGATPEEREENLEKLLEKYGTDPETGGLTEEGARRLYEDDVTNHQGWKKYLKSGTEVTPEREAALTSYEFNTGGVGAGHPALKKALAEGDWDKIAKESDVGTADGEVSQGLQNRRKTGQKILRGELGADESTIVRKGDNLSKIAKQHGMSVEELRSLNNRTPEEDNYLQAGTMLKVRDNLASNWDRSKQEQQDTEKKEKDLEAALQSPTYQKPDLFSNMTQATSNEDKLADKQEYINKKSATKKEPEAASTAPAAQPEAPTTEDPKTVQEAYDQATDVRKRPPSLAGYVQADKPETLDQAVKAATMMPPRSSSGWDFLEDIYQDKNYQKTMANLNDELISEERRLNQNLKDERSRIRMAGLIRDAINAAAQMYAASQGVAGQLKQPLPDNYKEQLQGVKEDIDNERRLLNKRISNAKSLVKDVYRIESGKAAKAEAEKEAEEKATQKAIDEAASDEEKRVKKEAQQNKEIQKKVHSSKQQILRKPRREQIRMLTEDYGLDEDRAEDLVADPGWIFGFGSQDAKITQIEADLENYWRTKLYPESAGTAPAGFEEEPTAEGTAPKEGPYGPSVVQNGVTFDWDGTKYVPRN